MKNLKEKNPLKKKESLSSAATNKPNRLKILGLIKPFTRKS